MTIGEKLLKLTAEYQNAVSIQEAADDYGVENPAVRQPATIAAEYESTLKELLTGAAGK